MKEGSLKKKQEQQKKKMNVLPLPNCDVGEEGTAND